MPDLLGSPIFLRIKHLSSENYLRSLPENPQVNSSTKILSSLLKSFFFFKSWYFIVRGGRNKLFKRLRHKPTSKCYSVMPVPDFWTRVLVFMGQSRGKSGVSTDFQAISSTLNLGGQEPIIKRMFISAMSSSAGFTHASVKTTTSFCKSVYCRFIQIHTVGKMHTVLWIQYFKTLH